MCGAAIVQKNTRQLQKDVDSKLATANYIIALDAAIKYNPRNYTAYKTSLLIVTFETNFFVIFVRYLGEIYKSNFHVFLMSLSIPYHFLSCDNNKRNLLSALTKKINEFSVRLFSHCIVGVLIQLK